MKKVFNASFGSMLNLTKSAFAILLMFVVVGSVSAQRLDLNDLRPASDEEREASFEAAPTCVPKDIDNQGNPCEVFVGLSTEIDGSAPYENCKLQVTFNLSICGGTFNIYDAKFDFDPTNPTCELEADLDDLSSNPAAQNILFREIYRKIGKDISQVVATSAATSAPDPFAYECGTKKKVITTNYYEGNCVSNCVGVKKTAGKLTFITRQVLCNKNACCITKSTFCTKNGVLQSPETTTESTGDGITCDGATKGNCPILSGVTWSTKTSPCFSSCGSK